MSEEQSDSSGCRVVKLGGSLLQRNSWPGALTAWLAVQPPRRNLLIVGGGEVAEAVRRWDAIHGLSSADSHWLAISGMSLTARLAVKLLPQARLTDSWARVQNFITAADRQPSLLLFDPAPFLESTEPTLPGEPLAASWDVTSDSIAARIATVLAAGELVLLKSCLPAKETASLEQATEDSYVDRAFARFARALPIVRFVHLSNAGFPETLLTVGKAESSRRMPSPA